MKDKIAAFISRRWANFRLPFYMAVGVNLVVQASNEHAHGPRFFLAAFSFVIFSIVCSELKKGDK